MTLFEAATRNPRLLALRGVPDLQTWLVQGTAETFQVQVRGRVVFSGPFAEAQARYECACDAQLWRLFSTCRSGSPRPTPHRRPPHRRMLPQARRPDGRYAGRRRLGWRVLVPLRPSEEERRADD
jgi:hypothetical protein